MIFDFSGLPASGKSYFTEKLCLVCVKNHQKTYLDFIKWDRTTFWGRTWHTLMYRLLRLTPNYRKNKCKLKPLIKTRAIYNSAHNLRFFTDRITFLQFNYQLASLFKINLLVNEGISQILVVLAVEFNLDKTEFIMITRFFLTQDFIQLVFYNYSVDETMLSFVNRKRHATKIDELNGNGLRLFLISFDKYLHILSDSLNSIRLERTDSFECNYHRLMK
ncbi:hypothetical protein [Loigolactobacillus rennini]|uniref:Uncharacterized protein n=2 Tax=Loigolactobacillus rennini TaxID=238013 RepID=A0A0R2CTD1_9LACO|nr:hypothetical protein [Loigolactobacillus rennini]KRM94618.1 hypothetical protein FC24_GL000181 [Loigolactobacillus rennini DSM 20253]SFZ89105.1 hypothetical protein LREN565_2218 [Loigolactobacillus rennini]